VVRAEDSTRASCLPPLVRPYISAIKHHLSSVQVDLCIVSRGLLNRHCILD